MSSPAVNYLLRGTLDADVLDWRNAIFAGGDTISNSSVWLGNRLVRALKANDLWDKCYMIDPCVGTTMSASLYRLKTPSGVARKMSTGGFVDTDYVETGPNGGRLGDGTTKSLDTLINPSTLGYSTSSFMLWGYTRSAVVGTGTSRSTMSTVGAVAQVTTLGWISAGTVETVGIAAVNSGEYGVGSASSITGFLGGGTNGSRANQFYQNGIAVGGTRNASSTFANLSIYAHATNTNGAATTFCNRRISSLWITQGLSASEVLTFNQIVQAFETALGRNV